MLAAIRKIIPQPFFRVYHFLLAITGAWYYRYPTRRMITIGVTGTSGKSTTVYLLGKILQAAGHQVGSSSTIEFCVGAECTLNKTKMTQLGRWGTQRLLARMRDAGCDVAVVETTSQGLEQFRHLGVFYDVCVLTNFYPEHIEAHGGFENYKNAKKKMFTYAAQLPHKKKFDIPKTVIVNGRVAEADEFLAPAFERKWSLHITRPSVERTFVPENISFDESGAVFTLDLVPFSIPLIGGHAVDNACAAVAAAVAVGVSLEQCAAALTHTTVVPGRCEFITAGQPFTVIVDFAFEPVAMNHLYETVERLPHKKIIHVFGGTGGGRDVARRPILGNIAGRRAALCIITNEDPYDEDPRAIMEQVAAGCRAVGKKDGQDLLVIPDRRAAIQCAIERATAGDVILVTGKGCEQAIVGPNNSMTPWDDRTVVAEEWHAYESRQGNSAQTN